MTERTWPANTPTDGGDRRSAFSRKRTSSGGGAKSAKGPQDDMAGDLDGRA